MPRFCAASVAHLDQARAAADRFDRQAAPELELAVDLERLPAVDRDEAHALVAHPVERVEALGDQQLDQIGIGAVLRHARHVVEELVGRVGAEIGLAISCAREIGDQRLDVVDAVIDDADRAGGEAAVAAGLVLGRRFEHQHPGALLLRRQRGAERGVAGADHDHIDVSPFQILIAPASGPRHARRCAAAARPLGAACSEKCRPAPARA